MSLDRSLKTAGALEGKRSVLKRAERVQKMKQEDKKYDPKKDGVLHIRKTNAR